jgi:hypothetical protein
MVLYMAQTATWPVDRFRAALDRILGETGLPQAGLAALVPMDQSQLSRWKSGSSRPKFDSLVDLGEALRAKYPSLSVGPNELLEAAGYAPPEPVARVSQVEMHVPEPDGVTISGGKSAPVTVIAGGNDPDPLPEDTIIGELRDQQEDIIWAFNVDVEARVAAILGYRRGLELIGVKLPPRQARVRRRPPRGA